MGFTLKNKPKKTDNTHQTITVSQISDFILGQLGQFYELIFIIVQVNRDDYKKEKKLIITIIMISDIRNQEYKNIIKNKMILF